MSGATTDHDARIGGARLARNTLLNLAGLGLPLLVAAVTLPALVRELGTSRFGVLSLVWLVLTYFGELGFARANTKFAAELVAAKDDVRVAAVTWTTVALQAAVGLVAGGALALGARSVSESVLHLRGALAAEATAAFYVLAAGIPLAILGSAFRSLLEAAQRFDLLNAIRLPSTVASYLLPLAGAVLGLGLPAVVGLLLVGRVLALVAFYLAACHECPALRVPRTRPEDFSAVFRFGSWAAVSTVVSPMLIYLDRVLLGALAGVAAVAYYTPSFELVNRLLLLPSALVGTLYPAFSSVSAVADSRRLERLVSRSLKYVVLLLGPLLLLLFSGAHELLRVWIGADFASAGALALRILCVGVLVNGLAHIPFSLVQAVGRPDITGRLHLLELPVQLVVAYALVSRWGVPGAAAAWTFRVSLDAVLLFVAARRLTGLSLRSLASERVPHALGLLVACSAAGIAGVWMHATVAWQAWIMGGAAVALGVLLWTFCLRHEERSWLYRLVRPAFGGT